MPSRAGRSLIWTAFESGGLFVVSLLVLIVLARTLGPVDLGTGALAVGTVQLFAMAIDTLLHDAIVQRPDITDDHLDSAFWACLGLGITLCLVCWLAAPLMGEIFASPRLTPLLATAGLSLPFTGAASVAIAVLRRKFNFKALALRTLYGRLAGAVAAVAFLALGFGIWSLIAQHLVQAIVNAASVWRATAWRPRFVLRPRLLSQLVSFGVLALGTRMSWVASSRLFTMLVGYFLGMAAVGYINVAQRVVDTLNDVLTGAAYNLALPIFSRQQHDRPALASAYTQATEFAALTVQPMFAGIGVCAPAIVSLFFGDSWSPAVPLVEIVAVGSMLQFVLLFGEALVTALGRPGYGFAFAFVSFLSVILAFAAFPPHDTVSAAIIWSARSAIAGPVLLVLVHRVLGGPAIVGFFAGLRTPLASVAAMVVVVAVIAAAMPVTVSPLALLLIQIPSGVAVYAAAVWLMDRSLVRRFIAFVIGRSGAAPHGNGSATAEAAG